VGDKIVTGRERIISERENRAEDPRLGGRRGVLCGQKQKYVIFALGKGNVGDH